MCKLPNSLVLIGVLAGFFAVNQASALPILKPFFMGHFINSMDEKQQDCANFRGDWKGICQGAFISSTELEVKISQQSCDYVQLGTFGIPVSGMATETSTQTGVYSFSASTTAEWSKDKKTLVTNNAVSFKGADQPGIAMNYVAKLYREGPNLIIQTITDSGEQDMECELEPQRH